MSHTFSSPTRPARGASRRPALLVAAALLAVGPAFAAAPAHAAGELTFDTSGEVTVLTDTDGSYFAPGTAYFEVEFDGPLDSSFMATWERDRGTWKDAAEAKDYIASSEFAKTMLCRVQGAKSLVSASGVTTATQFEATWGTGTSADTWTFTPEEWATIDAGCPGDAWVADSTSYEPDLATGHAVVRVPLTVIGPGEHELFIMPVSMTATLADGSPRPECTVASFPDKSYWITSCGEVATGTVDTTTITVPETDAAIAPTAAPTAHEPNAGVSLPIWAIVVGGLLLLFLLAGAVVLVVMLTTRGRRRPAATTPPPPSGFPPAGGPSAPYAGMPPQAPGPGRAQPPVPGIPQAPFPIATPQQPAPQGSTPQPPHRGGVPQPPYQGRIAQPQHQGRIAQPQHQGGVAPVAPTPPAPSAYPPPAGAAPQQANGFAQPPAPLGSWPQQPGGFHPPTPPQAPGPPDAEGASGDGPAR